MKQLDATLLNQIHQHYFKGSVEHNSNVNFKSFSCKHKFLLSKKTICETKEHADGIEEIYRRLKNENFGDVFLPDFEWTRDNETEVTLQQEFIKGLPFGTLVKPFKDIVYKEVVEKKGDWTFVDYNTFNFIVEEITDKVYAIDFLSYAPCDLLKRKTKWKMYQISDRDKLKELDI